LDGGYIDKVLRHDFRGSQIDLEKLGGKMASPEQLFRDNREDSRVDGNVRFFVKSPVDDFPDSDYNVITSGRLKTMKARLVRIGNSRGVRLPKPLIEEAGLSDEVELQVRDGSVVIRPVKALRAGWAESAKTLRASGSDGLLDPPTPTRFDEEEWEW
jgi:antitoxin MazE